MRNSNRAVLASVLILSALGLAATPSLAFESGDVPAPVDFNDMDGPGQSQTNDSGISGFDGNQGNDKVVGNAGGGIGTEPGDGPDGGDGEPGEGPLLQ